MILQSAKCQMFEHIIFINLPVYLTSTNKCSIIEIQNKRYMFIKSCIIN